MCVRDVYLRCIPTMYISNAYLLHLRCRSTAYLCDAWLLLISTSMSTMSIYYVHLMVAIFCSKVCSDGQHVCSRTPKNWFQNFVPMAIFLFQDPQKLVPEFGSDGQLFCSRTPKIWFLRFLCLMASFFCSRAPKIWFQNFCSHGLGLLFHPHPNFVPSHYTQKSQEPILGGPGTKILAIGTKFKNQVLGVLEQNFGHRNQLWNKKWPSEQKFEQKMVGTNSGDKMSGPNVAGKCRDKMSGQNVGTKCGIICCAVPIIIFDKTLGPKEGFLMSYLRMPKGHP